MTNSLIGFIGIGRMGNPLALRLIDAGHSLAVFDANVSATEDVVARGAELCTSPADVASRAQIIFTSLPTPGIATEVCLGENGIAEGSAVKTVIDLSTTGPGAAQTISTALADKDIVLVDAPLSGGVPGAVAGTLAVMVACPAPLYETLSPILKTFGKLFYVGDRPGLGQAAKLANNLLAATAMVVSSEAMAMGVKFGLDPKILIDIINAGSGRNSATEDKFPKSILPGKFDWGFTTGLSYKDVRLCVDEAENLGVPMVVGAAVQQMLAVTNAKYGPDSDFTSIAKVIEEWAGVEIRSKDETA